jgi:hypothetical protein
MLPSTRAGDATIDCAGPWRTDVRALGMGPSVDVNRRVDPR